MPDRVAGEDNVLRLALVKVYGDVLPPPVGANWAGVSRVGHDIVLEVGYTDIPRLASDIEAGLVGKDDPPYRLEVKVCGRYLLSPAALASLFQTTREVFDAVKEELALDKLVQRTGE